jgi:hypothetical protein
MQLLLYKSVRYIFAINLILPARRLIVEMANGFPSAGFIIDGIAKLE